MKAPIYIHNDFTNEFSTSLMQELHSYLETHIWKSVSFAINKAMVPTSLPSLSYPSPNPKLPSVGLPTDISVELVVLINSFVNFLSVSIHIG